MNNLGILEALLFAAKKGIEFHHLVEFSGLQKAEVTSLLEELKETYNREEHGVKLEQVGKLLSFYTKPEYADIVARLITRPMEKLTPSQLEVLAVIAKKASVKKTQIEEIRGKACDNQVIELLTMGLIKRKRAKSAGRPFVYSVTALFFELFHLSDEELMEYKVSEAEAVEEKASTSTTNGEVSSTEHLPESLT